MKQVKWMLTPTPSTYMNAHIHTHIHTHIHAHLALLIILLQTRRPGKVSKIKSHAFMIISILKSAQLLHRNSKPCLIRVDAGISGTHLPDNSMPIACAGNVDEDLR